MTSPSHALSLPPTGGPPDPHAVRVMAALRAAVVGTVVIALVVAHHYGVFEQFASPAALKDTLLALGTRGYLAYVLAFALLQPFVVPGTIFILGAPLIWPWQVAFLLSMAGTMAASLVGFGFARFVARDWVSTRIPARLRRFDEALATRGFLTVFWLRFVFWMPPMLHAFFGASRVSFAAHFWGSLAGYVIPIWLVSYFGEALFQLLMALPLWAWITIGLAVLLSAAGIWWFLRRRKLTHARG